MVYSRIKYGSIITGQTTNDNISKVQNIRNKLLKVLYYKNYCYSTNNLHNELSILKYNYFINQETLSFVYKYVHDKLPSVFYNYFSHRHDLSEMIEENRKKFFTSYV